MRCGSGEIGTVREQRGRAARPASHAAGPRACVGAPPAVSSTSLLRYSPSPPRGSSSESVRTGHEAGRPAPRSRHRRRTRPHGQRGLLPRRAAGLRRGRRHGRARGWRRRQPDRGRGVRPARRGGLRPAAAVPSRSPRPSPGRRPGSSSTATGSAPSTRAGTPAPPPWSAVLVDDDGTTKWLLANLGDSRIYRFTDGQLDQVSVDHSVVQELVDAGEITAEEAAVHPERHVITRALGSPEGVRPDFFLLPAHRGRAAAALQRRHLRDDPGRRHRRDPRVRPRPARRRRRPGARRARRRGSRQRHRRRRSMWWDWCTTIRTTPSASSRVSKTSWGPVRE